MIKFKKMLIAITTFSLQPCMHSNASPLSLEQAHWLSLFENHLRNYHVSILDFEKIGIARHDLPHRYNYLQHDPVMAAHIASIELRDELGYRAPCQAKRRVVEEIVIDATPLPRHCAA